MPRGRIYDDITQTIGETPLIRLRRLGAGLPVQILLKHEGYNPFASVKDRIGVAMLEDGIRSGALKPGMASWSRPAGTRASGWPSPPRPAASAAS